MTDFRFSPGDLVCLNEHTYDLRETVDEPHRRAYLTAQGVYLSRVDVDTCGSLIQKANQGQ